MWFSPVPATNHDIQNNIKIKRGNAVKLLGVVIDENVTWKKYIEVVENKISKNIGVLCRASHLLDFKNLLKIHFSFIHIYISYANIAWASTFKTKLQGILKKPNMLLEQLFIQTGLTIRDHY